MALYCRERSAKSTLPGAGPTGAPQIPLGWRILPFETRGTIQALKYSLKLS